MDVDKFKDLPILGILRGVEEDTLKPLIEAVVSAGLCTIEVTMNTAGAARLIRQSVKLANGHLAVGAGTVLSIDDLRKALDSGASFIVLPALVTEVVEYCTDRKIPVFAGAFTPDEIYKTWRAGATMVKVFPAKFFGPSYFREIKGPFQDIELLACGGVNKDNIREFFQSGASAVAFGASVFKKEWLSNRDFLSIENSIKALIEEFKRN